MFYPARFEKEENGYTVTFRDLPEAITCAESQEEAVVMAEDVLISAVEGVVSANRRKFREGELQ